MKGEGTGVGDWEGPVAKGLLQAGFTKPLISKNWSWALGERSQLENTPLNYRTCEEERIRPPERHMFHQEGGSVAEWLGCRTSNDLISKNIFLQVLGSSLTLTVSGSWLSTELKSSAMLVKSQLQPVVKIVKSQLQPIRFLHFDTFNLYYLFHCP